MLQMLQIVIGIVFVMLLLSLLASAILEMIAALLSFRGRHLASAIENMLGKMNSGQFMTHPFFQQLSLGSREKSGKGKMRMPSYMSAEAFSAILSDNLNIRNSADIAERIESLPEGPLKQILIFLWRQSGDNIEAFKLRLQGWYNDVMERVSGAYKRHAQAWLFGIGMAIAVIFNADALQIYHNLSVNATLREYLADAATNYANTQAAPVAPDLDNPNFGAARRQLDNLLNDNIAALETPLGLGWHHVYMEDMGSAKWWLLRLIGWLTTALSISMGATFWFEILKRLVNIRSSGPQPQQPVVVQPAAGVAPVQVVQTYPIGSALTTRPPDTLFESRRRAASPPKETDDTSDKDADKTA